jgi:hypothetical protein
MPRKRSHVREDALRLKEFEAAVTETRHAQAIRMLRLLEEEPDRTLSECAAMLNRPERTVRRWWKTYQEDGIEALLQRSPAVHRRPGERDEEGRHLDVDVAVRASHTEACVPRSSSPFDAVAIS